MKRPEEFVKGTRSVPVPPDERTEDAAQPTPNSPTQEREPGKAAAFLRARAAAGDVRSAEPPEARRPETSARPARAGAVTPSATTASNSNGMTTPVPSEEAHRQHDRPRPPDAELRAAARARRREERAEVRRFTRRGRRRRTTWIASLALVVALALVVTLAVFSPLLALRRIEVVGTDRVDSGAVVRAVDGQLGTPIALVDQARIGRELAAFSLIRSYQLQFVPPDTLEIRVTERSPVVAVQTATGYNTVDPSGVVIESSPNRPAGLPLARLQSGQRLGDARFVAMSEVLLALPDSVLATVDTASAPTVNSVTFTIGGTRTVVWGSTDDSALKARVLTLLLGANGSKRGTYDVSSPRSPVFRSS